MDKIVAILLPIIILACVPLAFHCYVDSFTISNIHLYIWIVLTANAMIIISIMLSDFVAKFDINNHSIQLTVMAFTAYLYTLVIELINSDNSIFTGAIEFINLENNIFQISSIPLSLLDVLGIGLFITIVTTAITITIVKNIETKQWKGSVVTVSISYLLGLSGYSLYVGLLMLNVLTK